MNISDENKQLKRTIDALNIVKDLYKSFKQYSDAKDYNGLSQLQNKINKGKSHYRK